MKNNLAMFLRTTSKTEKGVKRVILLFLLYPGIAVLLRSVTVTGQIKKEWKNLNSS